MAIVCSQHAVRPIWLCYFMTIFPSYDISLASYSLSFILLNFQNNTPLGKRSFGALGGNQDNQNILLLKLFVKQQLCFFTKGKAHEVSFCYSNIQTNLELISDN